MLAVWITVVRIIPACAGSTFTLIRSPLFRTDHPRLRGEHWHVDRPAPALGGSSPPARGARQQRGGEAADDRIIPACAGSTCAALLM